MARDRFSRLGSRHSRVKNLLRNPYFQRDTSSGKERGFQGWRGIGKALAILASFGVLMVVPFELVTNEALAISEVSYDFRDVLPETAATLRETTEKLLASPWYFGIDHHPYILASGRSLKEQLTALYPNATIGVVKTFPKALRVTVVAKPRTFILLAPGAAALADEEGSVTDLLPLTGPEGFLLPSFVTTSTLIRVITTDTQGTGVTVATTTPEGTPIEHATSTPALDFCNKDCATLVIRVDRTLRSLGVPVKEYVMDEQGTRLRLETTEGWLAFFDPIVPAEDQLNRLLALLKDSRYKDRSRIDYIDVRYQDRIYVQQRP